MTDAMGSLIQIASAALAIKNAVETVRQNKDECLAIEKLVGRVSALITRLKETDTINEPEMDGPLEDLAEALNRSLKLVKSCQKRSIMCLFCYASDLSIQLRQARDDISTKMMLGVLATNIQFTVFFTRIQRIGPAPMHAYTHRYQVAAGQEPSAILPTGLTRFELLELEAATNNFSHDNIIGKGSSAVVYKGVLRDRLEVAIKKLPVSSCHSAESICDELSIVSKLEHNNIVKLLGYGHEARHSNKQFAAEESHCFMVQEYMPNGSLEKIINGSQLNWSSRFRIIQGMAHGLHYLHEQRIIHLDLKPSNILLDRYMSPKISDFGIAKMFEQSDREFMTQNVVAGTMGYMAPEYIMDGRLTTMVDIYSFGIILLVTISGMCKFKPPKLKDLAAWAWGARQAGPRMKELFDPSLLYGDDQLQMEKCMEIGLLCTQYDREDRPTMLDVLEMLDGNKMLWTPKKPAYLQKRVRSDRS